MQTTSLSSRGRMVKLVNMNMQRVTKLLPARFNASSYDVRVSRTTVTYLNRRSQLGQWNSAQPHSRSLGKASYRLRHRSHFDTCIKHMRTQPCIGYANATRTHPVEFDAPVMYTLVGWLEFNVPCQHKYG